MYQRRVADPLLRRMESIPGIANAEMIDMGNRRGIAIELQPGSEFRDAYRAARDMAANSLGSAFSGITIVDSRDQTLIDSFYRMHFHVQQAMATGQFTAMAEAIASIAREDKLTQQRVFVGEDSIYIHLSHGNHHLYEVIRRPSQSRAVLE